MADLSVFGTINLEIRIGECDHRPNFGEHLIVPSVEYRKGGSLLFTVLPLARLGIGSLPIGIAGDDEAGHALLNELRDYRLPVNAIELIPEYTTPCTVSLYNAAKERIQISYKGLPVNFDSELFTSKYGHFIGESKFFMMTGLFMISGLNIEEGIEIVRYAFNQRTQVILDAGWNPHGWQSIARESMLELLQFVSVFIVKKNEGQSLTGSQDPVEIAQILNNYGPQKVIVRSEDGETVALSGSGVELVPRYTVPLVNSTGMNEIFGAGIAYGLLHDWHMRRILIFSNALSALCSSQEYHNYPTRIEVERFIDGFEE